jgi:hypothetical protein
MLQAFKKIFNQKHNTHDAIKTMEAKKRALEIELERLTAIEQLLKNVQRKN